MKFLKNLLIFLLIIIVIGLIVYKIDPTLIQMLKNQLDNYLPRISNFFYEIIYNLDNLL